jgi:hypothetical protein
MTEPAPASGRRVGRLVAMAVVTAAAFFAVLRYFHAVSHSNMNELHQIRTEMGAAAPWSAEREAGFRSRLDGLAAKAEEYQPIERARYLFLRARWTARAASGGDAAESARLYAQALELDRRMGMDDWLREDLPLLEKAGADVSRIRKALER